MSGNQTESYVTEQTFKAGIALLDTKIDNQNKIINIENSTIKREYSDLSTAMKELAESIRISNKDLKEYFIEEIKKRPKRDEIDIALNEKAEQYRRIFNQKLPNKVNEIINEQIGKWFKRFIISAFGLAILSIAGLGIKSYINKITIKNDSSIIKTLK